MFEKLKHSAGNICDRKCFQYPTMHLCTHESVSMSFSYQTLNNLESFFQLLGLAQLPWLKEVEGGLRSYCILFPESPLRQRGGGPGTIPGVLVVSSYQKPYTKAPGKDGLP